MSLYDTWGPHHRLVFPSRTVWDWVNQPESEWLIDTIGTPYFLFPNTIIYSGSLRPDQAYITRFQLYPRGVGDSEFQSQCGRRLRPDGRGAQHAAPLMCAPWFKG